MPHAASTAYNQSYSNSDTPASKQASVTQRSTLNLADSQDGLIQISQISHLNHNAAASSEHESTATSELKSSASNRGERCRHSFLSGSGFTSNSTYYGATLDFRLSHQQQNLQHLQNSLRAQHSLDLQHGLHALHSLDLQQPLRAQHSRHLPRHQQNWLRLGLTIICGGALAISSSLVLSSAAQAISLSLPEPTVPAVGTFLNSTPNGTDNLRRTLLKTDSSYPAITKLQATGSMQLIAQAEPNFAPMSFDGVNVTPMLDSTSVASPNHPAPGNTTGNPAIDNGATAFTDANGNQVVEDGVNSGQGAMNSFLLQESHDLDYERDLIATHKQLVQYYKKNYEGLSLNKQPANKSDPCMLSSDMLNGVVNNNSLVFWEGGCQNGKAQGFGRVYVVNGGRKSFEMLTNFHADNAALDTTYYSKNTQVNSHTVFFYGKANRDESSGVTITRNNVDNDLTVSMNLIDKVNLITYQKETSQNSRYVLDILDMGNYAHFIHDLNDTPYRSLSMSYRLLDRETNINRGYNFTGFANGTISGKFSDAVGATTNQVVPIDVLQRVIEINHTVNLNIEASIKNVIESLPVVDAYLNVVCDASYNNPVCTKLQCKQICDPLATISPNNSEVKDLLLRLVDHHNKYPIRLFLENAIAQRQNPNNQLNANQSLAESPNLPDLGSGSNVGNGTENAALPNLLPHNFNAPQGNSAPGNQSLFNPQPNQGYGQVTPEQGLPAQPESIYEAKGPSKAYQYQGQGQKDLTETEKERREEILDVYIRNRNSEEVIQEQNSPDLNLP